jgi:hypothetical protein
VLVNASFTFVWLRKADHAEVARVQLEEGGYLERIPPDQHGKILERQAGLLPMFAWLGPLVFLPLVILALAALFLVTYRFFYEADTTFAQSLAVLAWSFLAFYLLATTLMVIVLVLKGEWSVDPRTVLQASPAALVDRTAVPKPVYDLLDSLDLFSAWLVFLLAAGYAATARRSVGSAAIGILAWWGLYVLLKVALAAVF